MFLGVFWLGVVCGCCCVFGVIVIRYCWLLLGVLWKLVIVFVWLFFRCFWVCVIVYSSWVVVVWVRLGVGNVWCCWFICLVDSLGCLLGCSCLGCLVCWLGYRCWFVFCWLLCVIVGWVFCVCGWVWWCCLVGCWYCCYNGGWLRCLGWGCVVF